MTSKFLFSLEIETNRIKNTLSKIDFYNKNGYKIFLPNNFDINNNNNQYIEKLVLKEYRKEDYDEVSNFLNIKIIENINKINIAFQQTDFILEEEYNIFLTKYGVGGSYNPPREIILNFQAKEKEKLLKTIIHETIHLSINDLIIKYNISHWEKELIVDLFFDNILPEFNIPQNIKLETNRIEVIKNIFKTNFPNTENIIKKIGGMV